jgi:hypothetical protein
VTASAVLLRYMIQASPWTAILPYVEIAPGECRHRFWRICQIRRSRPPICVHFDTTLGNGLTELQVNVGLKLTANRCGRHAGCPEGGGNRYCKLMP